jgi:hypothetical protein
VNASVGEVVRPPTTDRPALADPTTATLLTVVARRVKGTVSGFALAPLLALSFGMSLIGGWAFRWPIVILTGIQVGCMGIVLGQAGYAQVRFGRWLPSARRLLAMQAWRPVAATVVRRGSAVRGTVVAVHDGGDDPWHLRAAGLYDAVGSVIAGTGRVWLVGPDAKGWLALRVDGVHAPWPARRVRWRSEPAAREPEAPDRTGTAADDPVAASWAATASRLVLLRLWPIVFMIAAIALAAVALAITTSVVTQWVVFALVFILPCVIVGLVRLRRTRTVRALPALLRAGPWVRVGARLGPWLARPSGVADASGTVLLDNGTTLAIALPDASVDLLGNIWETGTVWLAGEPASGRTLAAGFPGYPVLGVARFP